MEMKFLSIFADQEKLLDPFSDEERGQLLTAMMAYAFRGEDIAPEGNARYIWPVFRKAIDDCREKATRNQSNGNRGGRPKKETQSEPGETQNNPEETQENPEKPSDNPTETHDNPEEPRKTNINTNTNIRINTNTNNRESTGGASAPTRTRFRPPTITEVRAYCAERKNGVDAQRFLDYYESNGWHVGKNPMKDWRAAVRNWERGSSAPTGGGYTAKSSDIMQRHDYSASDFASMTVDLDAE